MFAQLDPALPLHVLGKGDGYAIGLIDYGQEHNLIWVTALDASGEIWCAPNHKVRLGKNWTMGRSENPLVTQSKAVAHDLAYETADPVIASGGAPQRCGQMG